MSSFRQDVETNVPALRRYARALTRDGELADDLVQDTLVRALRFEHLFHGGGNPVMAVYHPDQSESQSPSFAGTAADDLNSGG